MSLQIQVAASSTSAWTIPVHSAHTSMASMVCQTTPTPQSVATWQCLIRIKEALFMPLKVMIISQFTKLVRKSIEEPWAWTHLIITIYTPTKTLWKSWSVSSSQDTEPSTWTTPTSWEATSSRSIHTTNADQVLTPVTTSNEVTIPKKCKYNADLARECHQYP